MTFLCKIDKHIFDEPCDAVDFCENGRKSHSNTQIKNKFHKKSRVKRPDLFNLHKRPATREKRGPYQSRQAMVQPKLFVGFTNY